jgi:hypothetical protein
MIEPQNKMTNEIIAKNANETWGTHDLMVPTTKVIKEFSAAHGEIGTASAITKFGKKKFMERWKPTILSHQVMALLTPEAQASIKIHKKTYQWTDPISDEVIMDGCSLLNIVLKLMRPNVQINVYTKLAKIKSIKPVDYG